ncbi:MAG: GNAT family N-acetyltransferase [Candidatus Cloacimonetes bacterium]|nr:GNAT family N-acetyltransferase [Candidatus Cloacimonadota bacterium]
MEKSKKHIRRLRGEKVSLAILNPELADRFTVWINDLEVSHYLTSAPNLYSMPLEKQIIDKMAMSTDPTFIILDNEYDKMIGICSLHNLDYVNRTAELGIFIGDKNYWGEGFGVGAINLLLDHAFNIANLNSVMLETYGYNTRAQRCFEKCGFKVIGSRRQARLFAGVYHDVIFMDILAEGFESLYVKPMLERHKRGDSGKSKLEIL